MGAMPTHVWCSWENPEASAWTSWGAAPPAGGCCAAPPSMRERMLAGCGKATVGSGESSSAPTAKWMSRNTIQALRTSWFHCRAAG